MACHSPYRHAEGHLQLLVQQQHLLKQTTLVTLCYAYIIKLLVKIDHYHALLC